MTQTAQLGLEGMPRRLYACTPTRLATWLDCPRRFRLTYLDRPPPAKGLPWAHNSMGVSVHNALRNWWDLPRHRRTPGGAVALLQRDWLTEGYRDAEQASGWLERAGAMVAGYVATLDPADEPVGVERTVAVRTSRLALRGRVDRIDRAGDEVVVIDYKTGRHVLSVDDARGSLALALYAGAAASTLRASCRRVELHHLPTGAVLSWEHTDESLARQLGRAEAIAAEAQAAEARWQAGLTAEEVDEVFPPRVGSLCGWCDFSQHCPQGRASAPRRRSWEGLEPVGTRPEEML